MGSEDERLDGLRKDYRTTLNRICNVVGHPPISPDEGHTASIAERVESLSRDHHRLSEVEEATRVHPMAKYAASLEHHDEHHRREAELEAEIERLRGELERARAANGIGKSCLVCGKPATSGYFKLATGEERYYCTSHMGTVILKEG